MIKHAQSQGISVTSKQSQGNCDTTKQVVVNKRIDPLSIKTNSPSASEACSCMEYSSFGIKKQIVDFTEDKSTTTCNHCSSKQERPDKYYKSGNQADKSANPVFLESPSFVVEGGATIHKASMFDWSRGARNKKHLEKAGSDPAQKGLLSFIMF